jgi:hypothetical protein
MAGFRRLHHDFERDVIPRAAQTTPVVRRERIVESSRRFAIAGEDAIRLSTSDCT